VSPAHGQGNVQRQNQHGDIDANNDNLSPLSWYDHKLDYFLNICFSQGWMGRSFLWGIGGIKRRPKS
jgi:hypothetical protein